MEKSCQEGCFEGSRSEKTVNGDSSACARVKKGRKADLLSMSFTGSVAWTHTQRNTEIQKPDAVLCDFQKGFPYSILLSLFLFNQIHTFSVCAFSFFLVTHSSFFASL